MSTAGSLNATERIGALMKAIGAMYGKRLHFEVHEWSFAATYSGVYFLLSGEEIVYVGQSVNTAARVGGHVADKTFDRCLVMPVKQHLLEPLEAVLILCLAPKYNRQLVPPHFYGLADEAKRLKLQLAYIPFEDEGVTEEVA